MDPTLTTVQACVVAMAHLRTRHPGSTAALAFVTAAGPAARDPAAIATAVREVTGAELIIGCCGGWVWSESGAPGEAGVCVLVISGCNAVAALAPQLGRDPAGAARRLSRELTAGSEAPDLPLVLLLFDPRRLRPAPFLSAMREGLPPGTPVLGGGSAVENGSAWLLLAHTTSGGGLEIGVREDAALAVSLPGTRMTWGLTQSFQPITDAMEITAVHGRDLQGLDGRDAWSVLSEHVDPGLLIDDAWRWRAMTAAMPARTPDDRTHYRLIPIEAVDPGRRTVRLASPVPAGGRLAFNLRDTQRAGRDLRAMLQRLRIRSAGARFGLHIDAADRGGALFGSEEHDRRNVAEAFPGLPVVGWRAPRQLAPLQGFPEAHFSSAALLLMA